MTTKKGKSPPFKSSPKPGVMILGTTVAVTIVIWALISLLAIYSSYYAHKHPLIDWLHLHGGALPSVQPRYHNNKMNGFQTSKVVFEGDPLIFIPRKLFFTLSNASPDFQNFTQTLKSSKMQKLGKENTDTILLSLMLIHEYLKGEESLWKPYIDSLPSPMEVHRHFIYSNEQEYQLLATVSTVGTKVQELYSLENTTIHFVNEAAQGTPFFPLENQKASISQLCKWAIYWVKSKSIFMNDLSSLDENEAKEKVFVLVPLLDQVEAKRGLSRTKAGKYGLVLESKTQQPTGSVVSLSYGSTEPSEYAVTTGTMAETDFLHLGIQYLAEWSALQKQVFQRFHCYGLYKLPRKQLPSSHVIDCMRLLSMKEEQLATVNITRERIGFVSWENERLALKGIKEGLMTLYGYQRIEQFNALVQNVTATYLMKLVKGVLEEESILASSIIEKLDNHWLQAIVY